MSRSTVQRCRECGHVDGKLLDRRAIMDEYGVGATVAEAWMRQLPKVQRPGGARKVFVHRAAVERLIQDATVPA